MESSQGAWGTEPLDVTTASEIQMATFLIQEGAEVNFFKRKTFPALHLAVMRNSPEIVSALLSSGAIVNHVHSTGITALGMTCINDHGNILFKFSKASEKPM